MPPHQEEWCDIIEKYQKLVLLAPANHGKTTIFSVGNVAHEITKNRAIRIAIVCNNDSLAEAILSEIAGHFEHNETLIETYGVFKPRRPKKWNKWQIQVEGAPGTMGKKDATVTAVGAMSAIKGARFDLILGDDIVDEKNSKDYDKCNAMWEWFWSVLIPRAEDKNTPVRLMGTVEHESDIYHRFMQNSRGYKVIKQQAILDEGAKKVLWPEKHSYEYMAHLRSANFSSFMKTYQNVIVGSEVAKISQDKIDACYDGSMKMYPHNIPDEIRKRYKYILTGVDPAWTTKRRSKYAVILTIGYTHDEEREVLDIFREKVEYDQLFSWIKTKYGNLRPQYVLVESNNMQARLVQEVKNAAIPTKAVFTTDSKNDINVGIPMLYSVISAGKLRLPTGDEPSRKLSEQLMAEILSYPNGEYSDMLMGLYFCEQEIRKRSFSAMAVQKSATTGRTFGQKFSKRGYSLCH